MRRRGRESRRRRVFGVPLSDFTNTKSPVLRVPSVLVDCASFLLRFASRGKISLSSILRASSSDSFVLQRIVSRIESGRSDVIGLGEDATPHTVWLLVLYFLRQIPSGLLPKKIILLMINFSQEESENKVDMEDIISEFGEMDVTRRCVFHFLMSLTNSLLPAKLLPSLAQALVKDKQRAKQLAKVFSTFSDDPHRRIPRNLLSEDYVNSLMETFPLLVPPNDLLFMVENNVKEAEAALVKSAALHGDVTEDRRESLGMSEKMKYSKKKRKHLMDIGTLTSMLEIAEEEVTAVGGEKTALRGRFYRRMEKKPPVKKESEVPKDTEKEKNQSECIAPHPPSPSLKRSMSFQAQLERKMDFESQDDLSDIDGFGQSVSAPPSPRTPSLSLRLRKKRDFDNNEETKAVIDFKAESSGYASNAAAIFKDKYHEPINDKGNGKNAEKSCGGMIDGDSRVVGYEDRWKSRISSNDTGMKSKGDDVVGKGNVFPSKDCDGYQDHWRNRESVGDNNVELKDKEVDETVVSDSLKNEVEGDEQSRICSEENVVTKDDVMVKSGEHGSDAPVSSDGMDMSNVVKKTGSKDADRDVSDNKAIVYANQEVVAKSESVKEDRAMVGKGLREIDLSEVDDKWIGDSSITSWQNEDIKVDPQEKATGNAKKVKRDGYSRSPSAFTRSSRRKGKDIGGNSSVYQRLYVRGLASKVRVEKWAQEERCKRLEEEEKGDLMNATFTPKLSARSRMLSMRRRSLGATTRRSHQMESYRKEAEESFTFTPQIPKKSKELAEKRKRRVSSGNDFHREKNEKRSQSAPKVQPQHTISKEKLDNLVYSYIDKENMLSLVRSRLDGVDADTGKQLFHPTIPDTEGGVVRAGKSCEELYRDAGKVREEKEKLLKIRQKSEVEEVREPRIPEASEKLSHKLRQEWWNAVWDTLAGKENVLSVHDHRHRKGREGKFLKMLSKWAKEQDVREVDKAAFFRLVENRPMYWYDHCFGSMRIEQPDDSLDQTPQTVVKKPRIGMDDNYLKRLVNEKREWGKKLEGKRRQRQELEQRECTFAPELVESRLVNSVSEKSGRRKHGETVMDRLLYDQKESEERKEVKRVRQSRKQLEECTFAPDLSRTAKKPRSRHIPVKGLTRTLKTYAGKETIEF